MQLRGGSCATGPCQWENDTVRKLDAQYYRRGKKKREGGVKEDSKHIFHFIKRLLLRCFKVYFAHA